MPSFYLLNLGFNLFDFIMFSMIFEHSFRELRTFLHKDRPFPHKDGTFFS